MTIIERPKVTHGVAEAGFTELNPSMKEYRKTATVLAVPIGQNIEVETREGWLLANKGDYLVVNKNDRTYPWPVKKEIFESTYVEVSTEQSAEKK